MKKQYDIQDIILLKAINPISRKKLELDLPWVIDYGIIDSEIRYFKKVGFLEGNDDRIKTTGLGKTKLLEGGLGILRDITREDVEHPENIKFTRPMRG